MRRILTFIFPFVILFFLVEAEAKSKLFNKDEVKSKGISDFPKWGDALDKHDDEQDVYLKKCGKNKKQFYCNIEEWKKFLDSIADKDVIQKVKTVNNYINKHQYIIDQENWGMTDYWESPGEFLFKNGDCEDYAIAKYMSLKFLGMSMDDMRVLILYDHNLGAYHSVLAVYHKNKIYILDNQLDSVITDKKIYHYEPIFSLNEKYWWRYM